MLKFLRDYKKNWLTKILFIGLFALLIISFALWGISDVFLNPQQEIIVAEVGEVKINGRDFLRAYRNQTQDIQDLLGTNFTAERARELGFIDLVLSSLTTRALFDNEARSFGLAVSEDSIRQAILSTPEFQDESGLFNELIFRQLLRETAYGEEEFVEAFSHDLERAQITQTVKIAVVPPQALVNPLTSFRLESRGAKSLLISPDALGEPPPPAIDILQAWYNDHKSALLSPEYRHIRYLSIDPKVLAQDIMIAPDLALSFYDENIDVYSRPERRRLLQILVDNQDDARIAFERLQSGQDFTVVAFEIAGQTAEDIDLEQNRRDEVLLELEEAVFSLNKGEFSEPISSPFGWHIVQVKDIEEASIVPFSEVEVQIRQNLALEQAIDLSYKQSREVEDLFAAGMTLAEISNEIGLELINLPAVDSQGLDAKGQPIEGLPQADRFLKESQGMGKGQESTALVETDLDGFFALRVEAISPPRQLSFDQARTKVLKDWQTETNKKKASTIASAIKAALEDGQSLKSQAVRYGLKVVTLKPFTRSTFVEQDIPGPLVEALFDAQNINDYVVIDIREGHSIAVLTAIEPADLNSDLLIASVQGKIEQELGDDLLLQHANFLRQFYPVMINDREIDELL